ncbi:hypothetical protein PVAND_006227 [Polypedilum vanderplanki]|uniref:GH18 domain-containing protein n=1 Tax=Polypedilum vanderplanki TaxID=319348 RepID=A0A9J6C3K1_POLVA|nr:hypothetical protein PVAND_006227 [Polypedilum vanderplanki]
MKNIFLLDPWQDLEDDGGKGGYKRLTAFKRTNSHLKVLLAIGGWNEGSRNYSELAGDPRRRGRFVKQASEFVRKFDFDGLDLDWEYPTQRNGSQQDKESFVLLVKELSVEFKKHNLYLSSAFGASKKIIDSAYNVKALAPYLDSFHIMCYDYFGSWDKKVGLNAPLETDDDLNVKFSIDYFLKLGAPAEKIMMGLPFYGRTFLANTNGDLGDETDDLGFSGPYTRENGFMGYNEICQALSTSSEWRSDWHAESSEAIARVKYANETQTRVVSYDSSRSIANKVHYAIRKGLGGLMVWSIDTDDFRGECDEKINFDTFSDFRAQPKVKLNIPKRMERNYPLLRTLNDAIVVTLDELRQEENLMKENEVNVNENNKDNMVGNKNNSLSKTATPVAFSSTVLCLFAVLSKLLL